MFGDLDWPLNASRGWVSASAEFLVYILIYTVADKNRNTATHRLKLKTYNIACTSCTPIIPSI